MPLTAIEHPTIAFTRPLWSEDRRTLLPPVDFVSATPPQPVGIAAHHRSDLAVEDHQQMAGAHHDALDSVAALHKLVPAAASLYAAKTAMDAETSAAAARKAAAAAGLGADSAVKVVRTGDSTSECEALLRALETRGDKERPFTVNKVLPGEIPRLQDLLHCDYGAVLDVQCHRYRCLRKPDGAAAAEERLLCSSNPILTGCAYPPLPADAEKVDNTFKDMASLVSDRVWALQKKAIITRLREEDQRYLEEDPFAASANRKYLGDMIRNAHANITPLGKEEQRSFDDDGPFPADAHRKYLRKAEVGSPIGQVPQDHMFRLIVTRLDRHSFGERNSIAGAGRRRLSHVTLQDALSGRVVFAMTLEQMHATLAETAHATSSAGSGRQHCDQAAKKIWSSDMAMDTLRWLFVIWGTWLDTPVDVSVQLPSLADGQLRIAFVAPCTGRGSVVSPAVDLLLCLITLRASTCARSARVHRIMASRWPGSAELEAPPPSAEQLNDASGSPGDIKVSGGGCQGNTAATSDGQPTIVQGYGPPSSTGPFNRCSPSTHNPPPFAALSL